ncbi:hypothetical protein PIB30_085546 [Stylosanthes scabra]|uniref:DUF7915 domain-containing protein n=1 Tax=Stylosanthes scabra TaxID=79078 RepID=A0ABU6SUK0_9FABA|nr:hypothetical protein [Stylosanthes scabra]
MKADSSVATESSVSEDTSISRLITPVVEYFHMLPYAEIITEWNSRKAAAAKAREIDLRQWRGWGVRHWRGCDIRRDGVYRGSCLRHWGTGCLWLYLRHWVGSLTIVQRTSNGGQDTRFGTGRCAFDDEPYGVAESYSREGVDVVVNSPRNPEIGLWDSRSNRMG